MCNSYWKAFYDIKVAAFYYQLYAVSSARWNTIISVVCAIGTTVFISSTIVTKNYPVTWAIITILFQIILAVQPFFPFAERKQAANYIFQDMNRLASDAEETWNSIAKTELYPDVIDEKRKCYMARRDQIEERFADSDKFPINVIIHKKAEKKTVEYFRRFEDVG